MTHPNPQAYDPELAASVALAKLDDRWNEVREQASGEHGRAVAGALAYAKSLADGGDPLDVPKDPTADDWRSRSRLVVFSLGLQAVYDEWNETRGERANPFSPLDRYKTKYLIAEFALDRIGEPLLYERLANLGASLSKTSSDDVAKALAELQDTHGRDLVLRRTKVDGKVAYLLRPRAEDEQHVGACRETGGRYVSAAEVPLEKKKASV